MDKFVEILEKNFGKGRIRKRKKSNQRFAKALKLVYLVFCILVFMQVGNLFGGNAAYGTIFGILFAVVSTFIIDKFLLNNYLPRLFNLMYMKTWIWQVIVSNSLFEIDRDKKDREFISYFPQIYYLIKDGVVRISIRLDGSSYQDKFKKLADNFEQSLRFPYVGYEIKNGFVHYEYQMKQDERIFVDSQVHGVHFKSDEVPMTSNLSWRYDKAPHALITGQTGKGKTFLLFWIIRYLLSSGAVVKIIDAKMSDLFHLQRSLGKENVVSTKGQILKILREAKEEMENRYEKMHDDPNFKMGQNYRAYDMKPYFVVFDEFVAFASTLESKEKKEMQSQLMEIVLKGRQAGVFMIIATQRADAEFLGGAIRDNMAMKMALGSLSPEGYRMIFGNGYGDLAPLRTGEGYVFIDGIHTVPKSFEAPFLDESYDFEKDIQEIEMLANETQNA